MDKLINYARECRQRGFNDEYIRNTLKNAGYQEAIINSALGSSGVAYSEPVKTRRNFNFKPLIAILMIIAIIAAGVGVFSLFNEKVGNKEPVNTQAITEAAILEAKNKIIAEQIEKINQLDISVEEKQKLVQEKTREIENLFSQLQTERRENLQNSIELINMILSRGVKEVID